MRVHRALLPFAALLLLSSLRCGGDHATGGDGGAGGSSGGGPGPIPGGDDGGVGTSRNPQMVGPDGSVAMAGPSDAATSDDNWTAPDVGTPVEAGSPGPVDITFTIQATQGARPISPYVYGVNDGDQAGPHHLPIVRNGGNRLTAFNWENNASNAGSDYMFENDDYLCGGAGCDQPGTYLKQLIDQASAAGAAMVLTVPIVDYVSADKNPPGDVRSSGSNYLSTRFKQNKVKGSNLQNPPDTTDAYVYQDEMVNWVAQTEPHATVLYQLDNEPDLWSSTHAEVHPNAVTYAELLQRDVEFAKAVKAVTPSAVVLGPVNYGWQGFVNLQGASDSKADGDFLSWWLGQMNSAAASWGKPVVDVMDLHWYSEVGNGGNGKGPGQDCRINSDPMTDTTMPSDCYTTAGLAGTAAQREQAPRSLWDTTYVENSWITGSLGNKPIELLPLLQKKIATNDPGMKVSFTEWDYGGGSDISGSIATADALGIFGESGVYMASLFPIWHDESFTYAGFDAFRNYDGKGAAFGDTAIDAATTDVPDSSVYASLQSADASHLVIVVINKATAAKVAGIEISHSTVYTKASVYVLQQSGGSKMAAGTGLTAVATNAFKYTMPAQSVSVIVPSP